MCVIKNTRIACLQKEISRNYVSFVNFAQKNVLQKLKT